MADNELTRRAFVMDLGKGSLAVAVLGITALSCSNEDANPATTVPQAAIPTSSAASGTTSSPETVGSGSDPVSWERVNLGFVSAYVLAREGEAAVVDTGEAGSETDIEASLAVLGLAWTDVGHVIVTHLHPDHQGSLPAVLGLADDAAAYAGGADIAGIVSPRELIAVGDGDSVFGLTVIATPGHTPGHISILDESGGLLVAGDALNTTDGRVTGANPDFTADMDEANRSIGKLAAFTYGTLVVGHGEPIVSDASVLVTELAQNG